MKKIFLTIFLSAICFLAMNTSDALASESSAFKSEQLSIATYTDTDAEGNITRTAPKPSANLGDAYKDWIFAGWYMDANCTTTVGKTVTEGDYYAKYVPSEVLSAKCQVSAETTDTSPTSQLRIVSTVDSLKYSQVGFDIVFNNKTIQYSTSKVFSKIEAATDGVAYGFSPNIFDLQSEYFITATLINIKNENFDDGFLIKPYWVTKDGTKVYGVSRYARVEDSYLGIVNVPVRLYSDNQAASGTATVAYDANKLEYFGYDTGYVFDTIENVDSTSNNGTVTVSAKSSSGNQVVADGMFVNLRLKTKNEVTLPKKNEFAVTMNSSDIYAPNVVYMNYITGEYSGVADTSWYDSSKSTFVLTTPEELYGLASLSQTNAFGGKTIYLGADITIDSDWTANATGHSYPWTSIGSTKAFAGTFDGQGRTINGIYVNDTSSATFVGLFAQVNGTVQNLNLENSYVASNGLMTGSITGFLSGNMRGVSSKATVVNNATEANNHETGGLVGRFGSASEASVSNCLFSGTVTSNSRDLGGIVGRIAQGTKFVEHCLNEGLVKSKLSTDSGWAGGLVGSVKPFDGDTAKLHLEDSVNIGKVDVISSVYTGSVVGFIAQDDTVTIGTTYASNQTYSNGNALSGIGKAGTTVAKTDGNVVLYNEEEMSGYTGYIDADFALSFYTNSNKSKGGYWVTRTGDTPMLKKFADNWADYGWYSTAAKTIELETVQELYGFSEISQTDPFGGDTIKLVKDITVNEGTAFNWRNTAPKKVWIPIGKTTAFAGTFDGQGHTISGIYVNDKDNAGYIGLFAQATGTLKDFSLKNSYFASDGNMTGSIVGYLAGNMNSIYSNAIVVNTDVTNTGNERDTGGLVGRFGSGNQGTISNCWFDGSATSNNRKLGGIVGRVANGQKSIKHCLNTGIVQTQLTEVTAAQAGGFVGTIEAQATGTTLILEDCLNTGSVKNTNDRNVVGSVIGIITDVYSPSVTINNTYATNESYIRPSGTVVAIGTGTVTSGSVGLYAETDIKGYKGYSNENFALSFYTNTNKSDSAYWVTRTNDTPMLKIFADDWSDYGWYSTSKKEVEIETVQELYGFSEISQTDPFGGDTIKLVKDITVNEGTASNWGNTAPKRVWTPIGNDTTKFAGTFDGQGNTINGIYVNDTTSKLYVGLFAQATGTIQNLNLKNSYVAGNGTMVGSIVGFAEGNIENVYSNAIVKNTAPQVDPSKAGSVFYECGGIVGRFGSGSTATISNCWFDGNVSGNNRGVGGIIGHVAAGTKTLKNCLTTNTVTSTVSGTGVWAGGLIGGVVPQTNGNVNVTVQESLNAATVSAAHFVGVGSVVGLVNTTAMTIKNSYAINQTLSNSTAMAVVGIGSSSVTGGTLLNKTAIEGNGAFQMTGLDFTNYWTAKTGLTPELATFTTDTDSIGAPNDQAYIGWYNGAGSENIITTAAGLRGFSKLSDTENFAGSTIKLGADITLNKGELDPKGTEEDWNEVIKNWDAVTPIGTGTWFNGTFDGQGHTIRGVRVEDTKGATENSHAGLFAKVNSSAKIQNFQLEDSYIQGGGYYVGSIVGQSNGAQYTNVYSDAIVKGNTAMVGGLVGAVQSGGGTFKNCWYDGALKLTNSGCQAGGLIGVVRNDSCTVIIDKCLNSADIHSARSGGDHWVGGLVGALRIGTPRVEITNSINAGTITVAGNTAGGIGSIVGRVNDGTASIESTYGIEGHSAVGSGTAETESVQLLPAKQLTGAQARYSIPFGFYGEEEATDNWVAREGKSPGLKCFVPESEWYTGDETIIPDTSWYKKDATNGSTYVIDTAAKLYGLVEKSKVDSYFYATVKLGADITINIGDADEWGTKAAVNNWEPISRTYPFTGKFDGQGHTIKGLYMDTDTQYGGLFAQVNSGTFNAEVNYLKNFRIENSYFQSSASNLGSVAGSLAANMSNVYSDAIVVTSNKLCGGLVGQFNGAKTISNCWFDGTVMSTCKEDQQGCGGLIGLVDKAGNKIENCLNTGDITVVSERTAQLLGVGGLVGMSINATNSMIKLEITDCISAGVVTVDHPRGTGSVIGILNNTTEYTNQLILTNVYTTNQYVETSEQWDWTDDVCTGIANNLDPAKATVTGAVIEVSEDDRFIGYAAYDTTEKLDFENIWVLRKNGVPALKTLVPESDQYTTVDTDLALSTLGTDITLREKGVDAGAGSYVITVDDTDGSIYTNYLKALADKGFVEFANNDAGLATQGVRNVVYEKAEDGFKWVVNVTHAGNEKQKTYVTISTCETLSPHLKGSVTYAKDDAYTASNILPTLTMMKLTNTTANGSSFVIQLSNGHFIINDGGFADDLPNLIAYLKELSNGQKPIVEAWVISHAHSDHVGVLEYLYKQKRDNVRNWSDELYVEGIYYNESAAYLKGNFEPTESSSTGELLYDVLDATYHEKVKRGMALLKTTEGKTPEVYRYRTGQRFTFADVTMDVVQMEEQILEYLQSNGKYNDGSNGTSASVMFTIKGKRVYIGGDEGYDNMFNFTKMAYNDTYLNNLDVYVAPHHGSNTFYYFGEWCTSNGAAKFGMVLFQCASEEPPFWQNVSPDTNYKLITKFTTDQTLYTYADGNVVLTIGDTISVSK